jgi:hypothetical protein
MSKMLTILNFKIVSESPSWSTELPIIKFLIEGNFMEKLAS